MKRACSLAILVHTTTSGTVYESFSNLPFGDLLNSVGASPKHFTGKDRDAETGLDYFGARYYGSNMGRFVTPDWADKPTAVPYAQYGDPQSLNLYAYVRNNPTTRTDADGHCGFFVPCEIVNWIAQKFAEATSPQSVANTQSTIDRLNRDAQFLAATPQGNALLGASVLMGTMVPEPAMAEAEPEETEAEVGAATSTIRQNAAQGAAFEEQVVNATKATDSNVAQQVTLKTDSGVRTRMDVVSTTETGTVRLQEAKSSQTAPLTTNQAKAHPEIQQTGATVVGQGKPGYPGGTRIPPTQVEVVRPQEDQ